MYKNKKFVAIIPARGGSVGIPKKNLFPLNGKPLIRYTVEAADKSKYLDGIYCSTDDINIAYIATQNSKCKAIKRPDEMASSTAKTIDCIIHALQTLKEKGKEFDYMIILQPTSPLRTAEEIDEFIQHIVDHNLPSCVSVSKMPYLPVLMRHIKEDGTGSNQMENVVAGCGTMRRQDAPKTYYVDGSLYGYTTKEILEKGTEVSLNDAPFGYISKSPWLDVDDLDDLFLCEYSLNRNKIWENEL